MTERFIFRDIKPEETEEAIAIEQICFPPNEACTPARMEERIACASELFLVAEDRETGKLAGSINGLSTKETVFRDEFFLDAGLYDPAGENIMLLGVDVLPEYRRQGLAQAMMEEYAGRERAKGRKKLLLTCLDSKVGMYEKFGFTDLGIANSTWGGEEWHEMSMEI